MDPFTHGLTGAAAAHLVSGKEDSKLPFLTGFLSAQLPDLDVLFQVTSDPLTGIELHRHFTHSLLFAPFGAIAAAGLFWFLLRNKCSFGKLYIMVLAAWVSAVLLDACTSYGTHLLLPLTDQLFSWNLISVVDPIVTIGMLIFAVYSLKGGFVKPGISADVNTRVNIKPHQRSLSEYFIFTIRQKSDKKTIFQSLLKKRGRTGSLLMISWLGLFLLYGGIQNYRVSAYAGYHFQEQEGQTIDRYVVKPTIGNQLLWRYTFTSSDSVYTVGVRAGIFRGMRLYHGDSARLRSPVDEDFRQLSQQRREDIARFWKLSDGYMISHPGNANILGDARYSMLPTSLIPLWGIDISGRRDSSPTPYLYFRDSGPEVREAYIDMLLGRDKK